MRLFGLGGPSPEQVLERGLATKATVIGIEIGHEADRRLDDYALVLPSGEVLGVRQRLTPDDLVRLGMSVVVCVDRTAAVIDWWATCTELGDPAGRTDTDGWQPRKSPPAPGIADPAGPWAAGRRTGTPATVRFVTVEQRSTALGPSLEVDVAAVVQVAGQEPYRVELQGLQVAFYAAHLCEPGVELPAWVSADSPDRVVVDWPAAAQADPGIGRPPALARPVADAEQPVSVAPLDVGAAIDEAQDGLVIEGVDLATLVTVQAGLVRDRIPPQGYDDYAQTHGIAPGTWQQAAAAWQQRCMSDWRVGAAYGEAMQAALRQR